MNVRVTHGDWHHRAVCKCGYHKTGGYFESGHRRRAGGGRVSMNPYESPREVPIEPTSSVGFWKALVLLNPATEFGMVTKDGLIGGLLAVLAAPTVSMAIEGRAPWLLAALQVASAAWYTSLCVARIVHQQWK